MIKLKKNLFFLLHHKTLRYFFVGKFLSDSAKWIQITTIPWLTYSLTGSSIKLGIVAFLEYILILFIPPIAGIIIKDYSRKKSIILINFLLFMLFCSISFLYFLDMLQVWHLYIIAVITGFITSFDLTIRQVLISDIVEKEKIINAIGFNSLLSNISRFFTPAIAGIIISNLNEGFCFITNLILILLAIISYTKIKISQTNINNIPKSNLFTRYKINLTKTISFIKSNKSIKYVLLLIALVGFSMATPVVLMPILAKDIYKLSATGFGILLSARGLGALIATFSLISKSNSINLNKKAFNVSFVILILIVLFGLLSNVYISFILFAILGYCMVVNTGYINSFLQISTPTEFRPIVMGFFVSFFLGFVPIGNLLSGYLSSIFLPQIVCIIVATFSLILYFVLRQKNK